MPPDPPNGSRLQHLRVPPTYITLATALQIRDFDVSTSHMYINIRKDATESTYLWIGWTIHVVDAAALCLVFLELSDSHLIKRPTHHGCDHPVLRVQLLQNPFQLYAITFLHAHAVLYITEEVQILWCVEIKLVSSIQLCAFNTAFQHLLNSGSVGEPAFGDVLDSDLNRLVRVFSSTYVQINFVTKKMIVCTTSQLLVKFVRVWVRVGIVEGAVHLPRGRSLNLYDTILVEDKVKDVIIVAWCRYCA